MKPISYPSADRQQELFQEYERFLYETKNNKKNDEQPLENNHSFNQYASSPIKLERTVNES